MALTMAKRERGMRGRERRQRACWQRLHILDRNLILLFVDSLWLVAGGGMEMSNLRCVESAVGGAPALA